MPRRPFIGVRISWLMFARNRLFTREASMASSRAAMSTCSVSFRSVMSSSMTMNPRSLPARSSRGCASTSTQYGRPSLV